MMICKTCFFQSFCTTISLEYCEGKSYVEEKLRLYRIKMDGGQFTVYADSVANAIRQVEKMNFNPKEITAVECVGEIYDLNHE
jgi:hypothetical protein